jgi:hypothetical protein
MPYYQTYGTKNTVKPKSLTVKIAGIVLITHTQLIFNPGALVLKSGVRGSNVKPEYSRRRPRGGHGRFRASGGE